VKDARVLSITEASRQKLGIFDSIIMNSAVYIGIIEKG